jgi:hypothetical protein
MVTSSNYPNEYLKDKLGNPKKIHTRKELLVVAS